MNCPLNQTVLLKLPEDRESLKAYSPVWKEDDISRSLYWRSRTERSGSSVNGIGVREDGIRVQEHHSDNPGQTYHRVQIHLDIDHQYIVEHIHENFP